MTRKSGKLAIALLIFLLTIGGLPAVAGAANVSSQDGIGYSGAIAANEVTGTVFTGYQAWPSGFTKGSSAFAGGVYDGTSIWLTPFSGSRLIKVDTATGAMTSYNSWPSGTTLGSNPFYGSLFDGTRIWLIPNGADRLIKVNPATGDMTGYANWPSGFAKSADAFWGGVFDGTNIWLIPNNAAHVVKMNTATEDMTGYDGWPSGFTKGSGSFAGGVFDGTNIWLVPQSANMLIKVDAATGVMTGFNDWPSGFTKGSNAFVGGVYDGENVWMIPFAADRLMKFGNSSDLSGLTLSAGTLSPAFSAGTTSYTASAGSNVSSVDVMPITADASAAVTVNGILATSGQASSVPLQVGNNAITATVTSGNGHTKDYSVTVTRATYASADLSGLTLSAGTLSPTFHAATTSYAASVGNNVTSIDVTPTPADADAAVTVNGSAVASGQAAATPLNVGDNAITVQVAAKDGLTTKNYVVTVTRSNNAGSGNNGNHNSGNSGNNGGTQEAVDEDASASILINGKAVNAKITASTRNGQTVSTVTFDPDKLAELLKASGDRPVVTIAIDNGSDVLIGELNGSLIPLMQQHNAVLEIKLGQASYRIPARQIPVDDLSRQAGTSAELEDIQVEIASLTSENVRVVEDAARKSGLALLISPLDFSVRALYGNQQVEVAKFNAFIERSIAIPDNIDPSRIATGVVIDADGTIRHAPTKVIRQDGKSIAIIRSLTNSIYSVISSNVEFTDVASHWSKQAINEMGSRLIVQGTGEGLFSPDKPMTRAEFAAIVVRGLGLKPASDSAGFTDVKTSDWYSDVVRAAREYGLIEGFADGSFRPLEKITREQAMSILAKAMTLTGLKDRLQVQDAIVTLQPFADGDQVAAWAQKDVAACILAEIVKGRSDAVIAPKASVTRAEVAVMLQQLLKKSDLI